MDPLSITGSIIAILQITSSIISICYDYRSAVKSASREVIQITDELNSLKDVLESLLRVVEKSQSQSDTSRLSTFEQLLKEDGPLVNCQKELERLKSKLEPQEGWRKMTTALTWPLKEGEVRRALEGIERLKGTMGLALSADQATLSLAIREDVGDLTEMFQKHGDDQQRQNIYKWLAAPNPYTNHVANKKKRQQDTGIWLLKSKQFSLWMHSSKSFLWLYGIPGSGKTVLCSTVIEHLTSYCRQLPWAAVAFFYFDFNDAGKRDVSSLVRSLIYQLSAQCEMIPVPLLELYQNHGSDTKPAEDQAFIATLKNLVLLFQNVYFVFDALDESYECEEVLGFIRTLQSWDLFRLHLTVTSRQLPEIEEEFADLVTEKICLHSSELNKDVMIYIRDKLQNDKALAKWPAEIRTQIQIKLLNEEDGMFQWVVCQFDMLRRCKSVSAIRIAMSSLPRSLDDTYDRLLSGIDEFHQPEVMKVLQALTVCVNHLTLDEIVEILAVDLDSTPPHLEPDSRLLDPRSILSMCSSLVTTSNEQKWNAFGDKSSVPTLRLAHASVADYLTRQGPDGRSHFHFTRNEAKQFVAQTCLAYLLSEEFSQGDDSLHRTQLKKRLQSFPFLYHCVKSWPKYLTKEQGDPEEHLSERTKEVLQMFFSTSKLPNGGNFATWVRMLIPSSSAQYVQNTPPLYYVASFGLLEVVRIILDTDKDLDIDALGGRAQSTALHVAVYRNHIDIARFLLEKGADPKLANKMNESAMYWAAVNGNEEMQNLLRHYEAETGNIRYGAIFERVEEGWGWGQGHEDGGEAYRAERDQALMRREFGGS